MLLKTLRDLVGASENEGSPERAVTLDVLAQINARLENIENKLSRVEVLSHGGRATYVGNGRVLTRVSFPDFHLGFLVDGDDRLIIPALITNGLYEAEATHYFLRTIQPTDHCLDVGANIGYFTCLLGRLAWKGRTIGVEADPLTYEFVRDNININYLEAYTTAIQGAASDTDSKLTLHRRLTRAGNTSIIRESDERLKGIGEEPSVPVTVDSFRVDRFLDRMDGRVDHIKLDVEGAEPLAFAGMQKIIAANPQVKMVMEWSPGQIHAAGFDVSKFVDDMQATGMSLSILEQHGQRAISWDDLRAGRFLTSIQLARFA